VIPLLLVLDFLVHKSDHPVTVFTRNKFTLCSVCITLMKFGRPPFSSGC